MNINNRHKKLLKEQIEKIDLAVILEQSEVTELMSLIRVFLENTHTKYEYPMLSLYCDWMVHDSLDRNLFGWTILERIDSALTPPSPSINISEHIDGILTPFGLIQVREELKLLLKKHDLTCDLVNSYSRWMKVTNVFFHKFAERPLAFPETSIDDLMPGPVRKDIPRDAKLIRGRIIKRHLTKSTYPNLVVNSFCILDNTNGEIKEDLIGYLWHISMGPQNRIIMRGQIHSPEQPEAFSQP